MGDKIDPKVIGREKLQLAIENLRQAEVEGAEKLAPVTYSWAKQKIYQDKKIILQNAYNNKLVEEASDDAAAAAAKLLSIVRKNLENAECENCDLGKKLEPEEAIENLVNEGGLPL